ncbi:MAG: Protein-glutamate methylesterase, partial [Verrucomicrobiales bacterium]|nr:Protein-glutamate methylesterase [Verrucomicrobiales bacterium]
KARPVSPELIPLIDAQLAEVWPRLCDRPNIAQIKKFALRLEQWASTYEAAGLLRFARNLHQQAEEFDLEHLFQTLRQFPDIRESLLDSAFKA